MKPFLTLGTEKMARSGIIFENLFSLSKPKSGVSPWRMIL